MNTTRRRSTGQLKTASKATISAKPNTTANLNPLNTARRRSTGQVKTALKATISPNTNTNKIVKKRKSTRIRRKPINGFCVYNY